MLKKVAASAYIKAPRRVVFGVLTDYEGYALWNPDVTSARVLAAEGEIKIVELLSPPLGAAKLILEFVESPDGWLSYHQVDRLQEDGLSGRWDLEEADKGRCATLESVVSWRGGFLDWRLRKTLPEVQERTLAALATRSQLLASGDGAPANGRLKLLDVKRRAGELEVTMGSKRFKPLSQERRPE